MGNWNKWGNWFMNGEIGKNEWMVKSGKLVIEWEID
jgi:hypothetical protein